MKRSLALYDLVSKDRAPHSFRYSDCGFRIRNTAGGGHSKHRNSISKGVRSESAALLQIHRFRMSAKSVTLSTSAAGVFPAEGAQPPHEDGQTRRIRLRRGSGPACTRPTMEDQADPTSRLSLASSNVSRFQRGCSPM